MQPLRQKIQPYFNYRLEREALFLLEKIQNNLSNYYYLSNCYFDIRFKTLNSVSFEKAGDFYTRANIDFIESDPLPKFIITLDWNLADRKKITTLVYILATLNSTRGNKAIQTWLMHRSPVALVLERGTEYTKRFPNSLFRRGVINHNELMYYFILDVLENMAEYFYNQKFTAGERSRNDFLKTLLHINDLV